MSAPNDPVAAFDEVARIAARAHERDRYLAALLSPRAARTDLIALAAFAGEIGRIPLYVSEPMMGRIRLQWWRERIETRTSGGHPVGESIIATMQRHDLPPAKLGALIEAHEDALDDRPFANDATLAGYVDRIDGTLFELAARINGTSVTPALLRDAGRAYGLARIIVETPAAWAHGRLLLPAPAHDGGDRPELQGILAAMRAFAARSREHLTRSAAVLGQLPRAARVPFLPLALVEPYLQALQHLHEFPRSALEVDPLKRAWRLLRCRWTGRIS